MKALPALILGLAAVVAALIIASGLRGLHTSDRYVTVKGVAERNVQADVALWRLRFVASGDSLKAAQTQARNSREAIMAFLKLQAVETDEVDMQRLDVTDTHANPCQNNQGGPRFIIRQTLMVRSTNIDRIQQATQAVSELVDSGVVLSSDYGGSGPTYLFKGLNDIKPAMLAEATAAARKAASQFAADTSASLGELRRANQGAFQILARDHAAGVGPEQQAEKTVRVVSTLEYDLD